MVYGILIFSAEGSVPLFSTFFTPEGNDHKMQKRQQGVIRKVVEHRLFQVQCSRDVLLACNPDTDESFHFGIDSQASKHASSSSSSPSSSFSFATRKKPPAGTQAGEGRKKKEGFSPSSLSSPSTSSLADRHSADPRAFTKSSSSSGHATGGGAGGGGGVYTPGDDWTDTRERRKADKSVSATSSASASSSSSGVHTHASAGGHVSGSASLLDQHHNTTDQSILNEKLKSKKRQEQAEEAMAIASSEVLDGIFLLQPSSLFSSPKLVLWKHVESISYVLICGAMENVLVGFSFLTLFISSLFEILHGNLPSQQAYCQQLVSRPDAILLVLHYLLPGGQLNFINSSLAKYLKSQIRSAMELKL